MQAGQEAGFTLLELVVVLVLAAILSAYASVRWTSSAEATTGYQADRLARDIRHVQALAMNWGQPLRLNISAGAYSVTCINGSGAPPCVNAGDIVRDPAANQPYSVNLDYGVSLTGSDITFDTLGRPLNGGSLLSIARTLTLTGGNRSWSVVTQPITGFVSLSTP